MTSPAEHPTPRPHGDLIACARHWRGAGAVEGLAAHLRDADCPRCTGLATAVQRHDRLLAAALAGPVPMPGGDAVSSLDESGAGDGDAVWSGVLHRLESGTGSSRVADAVAEELSVPTPAPTVLLERVRRAVGTPTPGLSAALTSMSADSRAPEWLDQRVKAFRLAEERRRRRARTRRFAVSAAAAVLLSLGVWTISRPETTDTKIDGTKPRIEIVFEETSQPLAPGWRSLPTLPRNG